MKITRETKSMYTFNAYLNIQCLFKAEICSKFQCCSITVCINCEKIENHYFQNEWMTTNYWLSK